MVTDGQTDRQTDKRPQDNYRNPRCACAPRVNKAYGKLRDREGRSPTSTNVARGEGEEVGYELVDVHHKESPPPPPVGELERMYKFPLAPGSPSHPLPTKQRRMTS